MYSCFFSAMDFILPLTLKPSHKKYWVNACEPTLMRKLCIISEELHYFFLPMLFKEAPYSLLKHRLLRQRNLAIKSSHFYLLGSAWNYGGYGVCKKSVNVLASDLGQKNELYFKILFPWKSGQRFSFVCLFVLSKDQEGMHIFMKYENLCSIQYSKLVKGRWLRLLAQFKT